MFCKTRILFSNNHISAKTYYLETIQKIILCYEIESLDIQCLQINSFVGESSLKSKAAFSHLAAFILL